MNKKWLGVVSTSALLLAACGGGQEADVSSSAVKGDRATLAGVPADTGTDEVLVVWLSGTSTRGNQIVVKTMSGTVVPLQYVNANNVTVNVSTIDELPLGLPSHAWFKPDKNNVLPAKNLRIKFKPGTYEMKTGWQWSHLASGHPVNGVNYSIILEPYSATGSDVLFTGSVSKSGTLNAGNVQVTLENVRPFDQLWSAADGRMVRARQPNVGSFYYVDEPISSSPLKLKVYDNDVASVNQAAAEAAAKPEFILFGNHFVTRHPLLGGATTAGEVTVWQNTSSTPFLNRPATFAVQRGDRYFLENYAQALDAPREWFFAKNSETGGVVTGTLKYRPPSSYAVEVPQLATLITMSGVVGDASKKVSHVQFDRLKFRYTLGAKTDGVGSSFSQGELYVPSAIHIAAARSIQFFNCEVSHVGGSAVRFGRQVTDSRFEKGEVFDTGANGIMVGGDTQPGTKTGADDRIDFTANLLTGNVTILENRVHSVGARYPTGTGVWVGRAQNVTIQDNIVKDTPHSGISVGSWTENSDDKTLTPMQGNNKILNNYVYNSGGQGLSDLGGIYLLGPNATTTRVEKNLVRKVNPYQGVGRAIYLDEYSSLVNVKNNIVVNGSNGSAYPSIATQYGVGQHFGDNNLVEFNVIAAHSAIGIERRTSWGKTPDEPGYEPLYPLSVSTAVPMTFRNNYFFPRTMQLVGPGRSWGDMAVMTTSGAWSGVEPARSGNQASTATATIPGIGTYLNDADLQSLCGCVPNNTMSMYESDWPSVPTFQNVTVTGGLYDATKLTGMVNQLSPNWSSVQLWQGDARLVPNRPSIDAGYSGVQMDSSRPNDWWRMAGANRPDNFKVFRDADKVTDYLEMTDDLDDSGTSYFPSLAHVTVTRPEERITVSFSVKFDAKANIRHGWQKSDAEWNVIGPQVDFIANAADQKVHVIVNGQDVTTLPINTWVTGSVVMVLGVDQPWLLSLKPEGGTLFQKVVAGPVSPTFETMTIAYFGSNHVAANATDKSVTKFKYIRVVRE